MRIDGRWMPSLLPSRPRCSSRFPRSRLPRRPGTPSLRHASVATAPAKPHCRHFARCGRTWPSRQVRTLMTLLSVSTLCCRRWCSLETTPTTSSLETTPTTRREPSRSSSVASPKVQADRSLNRVSAGPLNDVNQRGDRSPEGRRRRRTTTSLRAYHRRRKVTSHSEIVGGLPG
jgi:hypothetical protein